MAQDIILDTDIGDDVDDALALAVALGSPEINLLSITTVFRDAPRRALLTREVLRRFQRDEIPVYAGCSEPLLPDWEHFPGGKELGRQFETLEPPLKWDGEGHAVNTIIDTARQYKRRGHKLTLVAIGALTNVALALHLAPDIKDALEVRIMGGLWGRHEAEWNIRCDPEAAAMVFGSGMNLTVVSIDVTEKVTLSDEQVQQLAQSPHEGARFLGELIRLWGHVVTLHDPLTVLSLFSDVVTFEPMHIEAELCGAERALTKRTDGAPNAQVSTEVRVEDAKKLFMERVLQGT